MCRSRCRSLLWSRSRGWSRSLKTNPKFAIIACIVSLYTLYMRLRSRSWSRSFRSLKVFAGFGVGVFVSPGVGVRVLFCVFMESVSESLELVGVGVFLIPESESESYFL